LGWRTRTTKRKPARHYARSRRWRHRPPPRRMTMWHQPRFQKHLRA